MVVGRDPISPRRSATSVSLRGPTAALPVAACSLWCRHLACPIAADSRRSGAARRDEEDTVAKRLALVLIWLPLSLLWLLPARTAGLGQAPGPSYPVPAINVRDLGAVDDAQESSTTGTTGTTCTLNQNSARLTGCSNPIFTAGDRPTGSQPSPPSSRSEITFCASGCSSTAPPSSNVSPTA